MKILIVHPWIRLGGAELVVIHLANQLAAMGHEVSIATTFVDTSGLPPVTKSLKYRTPPDRKLLDGRKEAELIALACSQAPEGRNRWTLRLLAEKFVELEQIESVSYETIRRTLKKTNLSLTCENAG